MLVDDGVLAAATARWAATGDLSEHHDPADDPRAARPRASIGSTPDERAVIERASVVGRVFWWAPSPSSRRTSGGRA